MFLVPMTSSVIKDYFPVCSDDNTNDINYKTHIFSVYSEIFTIV